MSKGFRVTTNRDGSRNYNQSKNFINYIVLIKISDLPSCFEYYVLEKTN